MKRSVVWIVAVVAVLVAGVTAVAVTRDDDVWSGRGGGMMSSQRADRPDMYGMHGVRVSSEYA